jgi:hypothetical protein
MGRWGVSIGKRWNFYKKITEIGGAWKIKGAEGKEGKADRSIGPDDTRCSA